MNGFNKPGRRGGAPLGVSPRFMPLLALTVAAGFVAWTGIVRTPVTVFFFVLAGWTITLCLHEFGHAFAAWHGGDRSVAEKGYLTLDPLGYMHPQLSLILPVIFVALGGIGLPGGAVYIEYGRIRSKAWESLVSAAGPLATLLCLIVLALPFMLGLAGQGGGREFWAALAFLAFLQVSALVFNLLPIPGFDGFGVIAPWLPRDLSEKAQSMQAPIMLMVFGLFMFAPPVSRAFFGIVAQITRVFGVDPLWIALGFRMFRFWT